MGLFGIENRSTPDHFEIKWYGNWGGPGHGTEGTPVEDRLDGYYRDHDRGYGSRGYLDAPSDLIYGVNALDVLIDPKSSVDAKLHAVAAVGVFGITRPFSDIATTIANPVLNFREDVKKHGFLGAVGRLAASPFTMAIDIGNKAVKAVAGVIESGANAVAAVAGAVGSFFAGLF